MNLSEINKKYSEQPELLIDGAKRLVFGDGPEDAKIMLLGEAPGKDEDACGLPFQGKAGQLLNTLLERAGLAREDCYITNVVKARPTKGGFGRANRPPTKEEVAQHHNWLKEEIMSVKPTVIVTMGGVATKEVMGVQSIVMGEHVGKCYDLKGIWGWEMCHIPIWHPSYLMVYKRSLVGETVGFLQQVKAVVG